MIKLFVDTNVILDVLLKRKFEEESLKILALAANKNYKLSVSALSYLNIHYQLKKRFSERECRILIEKTKVNLNTVDLIDRNLNIASTSDFKDFEDAVQYQSALYVKADYIITRNQKDFERSKIPVRTPTEFLSQLS